MYTIWFGALISLMGADDFHTRQWASRQMYDLAQNNTQAFVAVCEAVKHDDPEIRLRAQIIFERTHHMQLGLVNYYESEYDRAQFMEKVGREWRTSIGKEIPFSHVNWLYMGNYGRSDEYVNMMKETFLLDFLDEVEKGVAPAKIRTQFHACERYVFVKERLGAIGQGIYEFPYKHLDGWSVEKLNRIFHWYPQYGG